MGRDGGRLEILPPRRSSSLSRAAMSNRGRRQEGGVGPCLSSAGEIEGGGGRTEDVVQAREGRRKDEARSASATAARASRPDHRATARVAEASTGMTFLWVQLN